MFKQLVAAAAFATLLPAQADTLALWTFEVSVPTTAGPLTPELGSGSGSASIFHAGASTYSNPVGNGSAESWSSNNWQIGDYYQFSFSTLGASNIVVSFDQTSSGTGPRDFSISYSTDGSSYTLLSSYTVQVNGAPNTAWSSASYNGVYSLSFDLSAVSTLNNLATAYVRLTDTSATSASGGTVASGGTNRIDNVLIATSAVPEPGSLAMLLAGAAVVGFVARRQRA